LKIPNECFFFFFSSSSSHQYYLILMPAWKDIRYYPNSQGGINNIFLI